MSISNLIEGLQKAKLDLTPREIAEIIWLWVKTVQQEQKNSLSSSAKHQSQNSNNLNYHRKNNPNKSYFDQQQTSSSTVFETVDETVDETVNEPSKVDLYPTVIEQYIEPRILEEKYPLQVPDAPAISNQRQLEKSLKSLRRTFKSLQEQELDENKTVNLIVEQTLANPKLPVWIPLFKPTLTRRWLDLVLVIEVNNSLVIWKQTITELKQFLIRLGIFNSCETWGLQINLSPNPRFLEWLLVKTIFFHTHKLSWLVICSYLTYLEKGLPDLNEGIKLFSYDDPQMRPYPPEAINSKGNDTLILLVSDLVSPVWYRSEMSILLRQWGRKGMVNLLQLLPERLWSRTVLGQQNRLQLKATQKIKQNTKLIPLSREKKTLDNQFKLPVTSLEAERLEEWSKFLMGIGDNQCIGYGISPLKRPYMKLGSELSPQERITRFQSIASPTALKLAELLSAVLVTLPVIRVIQYTMLPQANQSHIAEVLMGGLFKPLTETVTPNINPDEIEFKFFDGVRDELLSWLTVNEISFAIEQVSTYLADRMGKSLNEFEALLIRSQVSNSNLAKQVYPFAQVSSDVLQKLGGAYAEFANQISSGLDICTFEIATIEIRETHTFNFTVATIEKETKRRLFRPSKEPEQWVIKHQKTQAQGIIEELAPGIQLELMEIPGGTFWMGTDDEEIKRLVKKFHWEYFRSEKPQHQVNIQRFSMGRYPITQGQWKAIAQQTELKVNIDLDPDPSRFKDDPPQPFLERSESKKTRWDRPVEQVNWYQAKEFCDRLSKLTGKPYRLPSEAEWEYACRAVITDHSSVTSQELARTGWNQNSHQPFHFGETITGDLANYNATDTYADEPSGEYRSKTTPVGYFKVANAFGLYDMHGNVWEWCQDDFHDNYDGVPTDGSAWFDFQNANADNQQYSQKNNDNKLNKVIRGGSWNSNPFGCRCAFRNFGLLRGDINLVGFRVVSDPPRR